MKYTKELLDPIIKESKTWADVCRALDIKPMTGSQTHIKSVAIKYNIDFSHFLGQAWNKGNTYKKKDALEYCSRDSNESSDRLKRRLIRDGYKENNKDERIVAFGVDDGEGGKIFEFNISDKIK